MLTAYKWPNGDGLPYEWAWPEGVPRNYDELVREHDDFVGRAVARYNKVGRNFEELLQEVWCKLIGSRVLERFVESGARRLPVMMKATEACALLGINWKQWENTLRRKQWLAGPVEGTRCSKDALYATADILDMDEGDHWKHRPNKRVRPPFTAKGFKAYLQRAVHNHFANWCRTRSRKYKEQLLSPQSVLGQQQSDGNYRQKAEIEDMSSWENSIAEAMTLDEEEAVDLAEVIRRARLNLAVADDGSWEDPKTAEVIDYLVQQGRHDNGPQKNMEIIDFLGKGYSLAEAVRRVQVRTRFREKQRVKLQTMG